MLVPKYPEEIKPSAFITSEKSYNMTPTEALNNRISLLYHILKLLHTPKIIIALLDLPSCKIVAI